MFKSIYAWLTEMRFLQITCFFVFVILSLPFRTDHPFVNIVSQLLLFNMMVVTLSASGSKRLLR